MLLSDHICRVHTRPQVRKPTVDYDLSRLSTRAFEQLVQALAAAVIGPGIVVFGDGPDGGREATFDGRMPHFPTRHASWDGYLLVQAKFRQREAGSVKDADWALAELKKDLEKFSDAKRALRKPDYYLFATNVVLTPVARRGGKDRVAGFLRDWCHKQGLKGFHIWDHDQLCTLLDAQQDVRAAYRAWITPGDVLAAVLEQMRPQRPDFRSVMHAFLQKELRADQYVNLGQAGHREADRTPLARVFVDLPIGDTIGQAEVPTGHPEGDASRFADPFGDTEEAESEGTVPNGAMTDLMILGGQRLDPASQPVRERQDILGQDKAPVPGRIVLIGGPGQGKSTLSQFLCQVHRVALLGLDPGPLLPAEVTDTCSLIRGQCTAESLTLPVVPRFPLRVVLNHFAKSLADKKATSLFAYLRDCIARGAEREIAPDDLHAWLGAYPWLLVLDGLDEVPASSNRTEVLDAIQDFLIDAHNANADLLLVATSRPQGYNDDFSARYYRHRQLLPLDVKRALHYAGRLANERWGGDPDRVARVLARLRRAGAEEATARLMHSPLQVAIMTLLVDSAGDPPSERWRLFSDYYRVIYDRERQRDIPAARLLGDYQADIDAIHQRVALHLQVESEQAGGTDATMDSDAFATLVDRRLGEEGHAPADRQRLTKEIHELALQRLVFLVAPREGTVGFEVRSLQEFMAAQCLTNGPDDEIGRRLRAIAPAAHWRNVFLFAAGRCFHERQYLRDTLYTLCCELNEGEGVCECGHLERTTLAGSRLALDILEDGAVARQPATLKLFAKLALRIMELPPCDDQLRLAAQYQPALEDTYRCEIESRLAHIDVEARLGAWRVLIQLIGRGCNWAQLLADTQWPIGHDERLLVFRAGLDLLGGEWLANRWRDLVPALHPRVVVEFIDPYPESNWVKSTPEWVPFALPMDATSRVFVRLEGVQFLLPRGPGPAQVIHTVPEIARTEWHTLAYAAEFSAAPSIEGLACVLRRWTDERNATGSFPLWCLFHVLWWPLWLCIYAIDEGADPEMLIAAVREGKLGDVADWEAAERRWEKKKLTARDLGYTWEAGLPFDASIGTCGFPGLGYFFHIAPSVSDARNLMTLWRNAAPQHKQNLAVCSLFAASLGRAEAVWENLELGEFRRLIADCKGRLWLPSSLLDVLPESFWNEVEGLQALDELGSIANLDASSAWTTGPRLESLAASHPEKGGILRLLAALCRSGYRPTYDDLRPDPTDYNDPHHQSAALLVRLALGQWDSTEATTLARRIVDLDRQETQTLTDVLKIVADKRHPDPAREALLTALYDSLPTKEWEGRRDVMTAMQAQQRRRLSARIP